MKASEKKSAIEILEKQLEYMNRRDEEHSRYQDENQPSLFDDDPFFNDTEHAEERSQQEEITFTVVRKATNKKRNDVLSDNVEVEEIHYHPESRAVTVVKMK